jgi:hypothetical protein
MIPRDNVIQIQIPPIFQLPAVLAGIGVPFEDVLPSQFNLFFRNPVKKHQYNNPWNADPKADGANRILTLIVLAELLPPMEIEGPKIIPCTIPLNHLGMPHIQEAKGPTDGADVHCLPKAVQD